MKVYLAPPESHTNGGIRRVVEAQYKYLPEFGIEFTANPMEAEVEAIHVSGKPQNSHAAFVLHNHGMMWTEYFDENWCHSVNREIVESMRYAQAITSPSNWVTKAIARGVYFPVQTIYHGVDIEEWTPTTQPESYILWNKARTDSVSDSQDMNRLAELLPDIPFLSTFGERASNIYLVGNVANSIMKGYVQRAGLYLATARETFGIGTLEAMACGVPVVGWDYGGQSEIVKQGETGYLAPYGDYEVLAELVHRAMAERPRLVQNCIGDVIERWQWRDKIEQYANLYKSAAAWYSAPRPKVSVIVPAHNLAKYLPYTLKSIQEQTLETFECLIVDDCSTDETPEIARAIVAQDIRFRYLRTYENLKLSGVRNYGASKALGKYLIYVDADDMLEPYSLEVLSDALDSKRDIHIAYGSLDLINEEGTHRRSNVFPGDFDWFHQMAHQNQIPTAAMMRREVVETSGGWRTRQWRAEDAEFWARVTSFGFKAEKVTSKPTLLYRIRRDSKGSVEFRTYEDRDGNWLAHIAWRSANSAQQGIEYIRNYGETVPQPSLVPFGAQGLPKEKFWNVSHQQSPTVTFIVNGNTHLEDTLDSIMGQYLNTWDVIVIGKKIPGFPYVRFVADYQEINPKTLAPNVFRLEAGELLPNDWLNQQLGIELGHPNLLQNSKVLLQYVGRNTARTMFRVNSNTYFGSQGSIISAELQDVEKLLARGQWKRVESSMYPEPQLADQRR